MAEFTVPKSADEIRQRRDQKAIPILKHHTPVWIVREQFIPEEDSVLFNVVFHEPLYGWLNRRYRYDAFNDVLYHMGERRVSEAEVLKIQMDEPYLNGGHLQ